MHASSQHQNPPRATPTVVLWLMVAVVMGGAELLIGAPHEPDEPDEPDSALATVEMPQLHGSAAHRGAIVATAMPARRGTSESAKAEAASAVNAVQVAAFLAP